MTVNGIQQHSPNQSQQQQQQPSVDPVFLSIPKNKPAFLIWRVENLNLNQIPKDSYGVFFKGDTYIIYQATESNSKSLIQHIHLWIGTDSSADEQGIGAYKMVELDDYLGGAPIQHRECQGYETERFLSYFKHKGGIKYQNGGIQSGFHHYEKKFEPRLFQIKGKRNLRLNELSNMDWSSMNRNDSFLIDLNTTIFVWNGKNANKLEKLQALNKARLFRDERNGNCNIVIIEDGEEKDLSKEELKLFESKFPLKEKVSKLKNETSSQQDDLKFEKETSSYLKLYRCSDARDEDDGTVKIKIIEQKPGPLYKEDLNSDDSFIIDNGRHGIWVWIGKRSSQKERQEAMRNALGFLQAKGYDERQQNSIKVTRVIDGSEPVEFRALFNRWPETNETKGLGRNYNINSIAKTTQTKYDASVLHSNHQLAAESQMVDDGRGTKQIWYVQNFDIHKLDESKYGDFHSGDCYIIHYKYYLNNTEKHILYYWIGRKSTQDEQGTLALKTIELDNKLFDGKALQVRIVESKEPIHFMYIFDGKITIFKGGRASGFSNVATSSNDSIKLSDSYMLQIKSYGTFNIKAVQVDYKASCLNSNDVFIICHKATTFYVWCGKSSTGDEREAAKSILLAQKKEPEIIIETQEKEEFWQALGGKQAYHSEKRLCYTGQSPIARLFEISNSSGKLNVNEIYQFSQADLNSNDVMLLDAWDQIFLWIGSNSNKSEKDESEKIVFDYLKSDPSQRGFDTPVYKIKQGQEPPIFTGFFGPWDSNLWTNKNDSDYNSIKQDLQSKNQPHLFQLALKDTSNFIANNNNNNNNNNNSQFDFNQYPKYSYDDLIKSFDQLPENVLTESKEVHLNEDDFKKIFKMTYQQFKEKPAWKQQQLKKSVHLF